MTTLFDVETWQPIMTRREVADRLGLSIYRVFQIERRAMMKLRNICRQRGLTVDDFFDVVPIALHHESRHRIK